MAKELETLRKNEYIVAYLLNDINKHAALKTYLRFTGYELKTKYLETTMKRGIYTITTKAELEKLFKSVRRSTRAGSSSERFKILLTYLLKRIDDLEKVGADKLSPFYDI